ncbi:CHAD domain-containing protein [Sciscionella marina]|uniref:CHAD domain-containing protein n=1 Tax=Sciscionella marina TaxID=508770 RepID=UPI0003606C84|nr:CHAD domain-containing protein [Sciscionella marina]
MDIRTVRERLGEPAEQTKQAGVPGHVHATLDRRLHDLLDHDPGTRDGSDPEDLHQMRVAVRRMRSVLGENKASLDPEWTDELRAELGSLGRALGPVRDLDVLIERFRAHIAELPEPDRRPARALVTRLSRRRGSARRRMLAALDAPSYPALLARLVDTVNTGVPVRQEKKTKPAKAVTAKDVLIRPHRKLRRAVDALGPESADEDLHALRIKVKKLRYGTEMIRATAGKPAKRAVRAAAELQDILGEHQDACVAEEEIRAFLPNADPAAAFAVGRIAEREEAGRRAARDAWHPAWLKLDEATRVLLR